MVAILAFLASLPVFWIFTPSWASLNKNFAPLLFYVRFIVHQHWHLGAFSDTPTAASSHLRVRHDLDWPVPVISSDIGLESQLLGKKWKHRFAPSLPLAGTSFSFTLFPPHFLRLVLENIPKNGRHRHVLQVCSWRNWAWVNVCHHCSLAQVL